MSVLGLGLNVLSFGTHSLSDDPVLSIFFFGGLYQFSYGVGSVVLVEVSHCFPL
jgi:hypothetical protein